MRFVTSGDPPASRSRPERLNTPNPAGSATSSVVRRTVSLSSRCPAGGREGSRAARKTYWRGGTLRRGCAGGAGGGGGRGGDRSLLVAGTARGAIRVAGAGCEVAGCGGRRGRVPLREGAGPHHRRRPPGKTGPPDRGERGRRKPRQHPRASVHPDGRSAAAGAGGAPTGRRPRTRARPFRAASRSPPLRAPGPPPERRTARGRPSPAATGTRPPSRRQRPPRPPPSSYP